MVIILNIRIIKEYIKKMTVDDVKKLGCKWGILLDDREAQDVYIYVTKNYNDFFLGNIPVERVLEDARDVFSEENYDKFIKIYSKYQNKNIR